MPRAIRKTSRFIEKATELTEPKLAELLSGCDVPAHKLKIIASELRRGYRAQRALRRAQEALTQAIKTVSKDT